MPGSKTPRLQRLLHVGLDVAIMALIIISFLWGGATSRSEPLSLLQSPSNALGIHAGL